MTQVTKETLAARIAALESGPVSLKEEFYLAVMKELLHRKTQEPFVFAAEHHSFGWCYYSTPKAALKDGCENVIPLYDSL